MNSPPTFTRVSRLDSITIDKTYFTEEGYLVDEPIVTSVGIFEYENGNGQIKRELRLPEHVFAKESLASYEGKPITVTHPGRVDKRNVEREIIGTMLSQGYQDGEDVRCKIIIHGINEVRQSGLRELSLGYDLVLDETPGEWKGQKYDAIQTEIRINHLAIVGEARAGEQARLNMDSKNKMTGGKKMSAKTKGLSGEELKKTIAAYETRRKQRMDAAENGEEEKEEKSATEDENLDSFPMSPGAEKPNAEQSSAEDRVKSVKGRRDRRDQEGTPPTPESAMGVISQQDEDIEELLGIIEALQAKSDFSAANDKANTDMDMGKQESGGNEAPKVVIKTDGKDTDIQALIDKAVNERTSLLRIGDRLRLDGLENKSPLEAKKLIIKKVCPNMRLDGKGEIYINAAFDIALSQIDAEKDVNYQRRQMSGRMDSADTRQQQMGKSSAETARERMIERMMNGGTEE